MKVQKRRPHSFEQLNCEQSCLFQGFSQFDPVRLSNLSDSEQILFNGTAFKDLQSLQKHAMLLTESVQRILQRCEQRVIASGLDIICELRQKCDKVLQNLPKFMRMQR